MEGLDRKLEHVLGATGDKFTDLVMLSGLDPSTDFRAADLSGADLRHTDMRAFNLSNAILKGALIDGAQFNETVSPAQLSVAVTRSERLLVTVGLSLTDEAADYFELLGPRYGTAPALQASIDRSRHDGNQGVELEPQLYSEAPTSPNFDSVDCIREIQSASAVLICGRIRSIVDAISLRDLVEALDDRERPYLAVLDGGTWLQDPSNRVAQAAVRMVVNLAEMHGGNLVLSPVLAEVIEGGGARPTTLRRRGGGEDYLRMMVQFLGLAADARMVEGFGGVHSPERLPRSVRPCRLIRGSLTRQENWLYDEIRKSVHHAPGAKCMVLLAEDDYRTTWLTPSVHRLSFDTVTLHTVKSAPNAAWCNLLVGDPRSEIWRIL